MSDKNKMKIRQLKIDINKICRMCISDKFILREIHQTRIPKMLEHFTSIQVWEDDGLPSHVCVKCFHLITKLYTFKKKVERNDRFLRECLKQKRNLNQTDAINVASNVGCDLNEGDISVEKNESKKPIYKEFICSKRDENIQILNDGPPPLVPLEPLKKTGVIEKRANNFPIDTPPLVPIKNLANPKVSNFEDVTIKYHCNTCTQEFETNESLKNHKLSKCQQNCLQCNICQKEFKDSKKLIGHLKGHMVSKDYYCTICGKCYPNPSTFTVHMRTHTGERPFKCHICGKSFTRWAGVAGHMKSHLEEKSFKCDTCDRYFKNSSNLARHKIRHTIAYPFCCTFCDRSFNQSDNLQVHIKTYHTKDRSFLCNECGKAFVNSTRLNRHMWIHSGYKPYPCMSCSKQYSNMNDLKNHERRAHLGKNMEDFKKYSCDKCNLKFFHPCRLARHKKIHEKSYNCNVCRRPFSTENYLVKHLEEKHNWAVVQHEKNIDIFVGYHEEIGDKLESCIKISNANSLKNNAEGVTIKYIYDSTA